MQQISPIKPTAIICDAKAPGVSLVMTPISATLPGTARKRRACKIFNRRDMKQFNVRLPIFLELKPNKSRRKATKTAKDTTCARG
mmetsp:Transcript_6051/g.37499  ORF Transcript_6051/g.37499 Transcript_6051/m.37499 type:complete len:85 (-) Transcript_6051:780-1034(-)